MSKLGYENICNMLDYLATKEPVRVMSNDNAYASIHWRDVIMRFRLKSRGEPLFTVWALDKNTYKWDCWGEVHSPEDYPDLLERINRGEFWHSTHIGQGQYIKIYYNKNGDYDTNPNRLKLV